MAKPFNFRTYPEPHRKEFEDLLKRFVEVPTVSAEPEHQVDIRRGAELAAETIRNFGGKAKIIKTKGNPVVHGSFESGRQNPTVTVYNHMDVQPASRETEPWNTDPFTMVKKGDTYYGRGTTDDKGPALSVLFGIRAAREAGVPINIKLLWEFEEEVGSASLAEAIEKGGSAMKTDSLIVSDTIWVSRSRPACPSGLRGFQAFILRLETAETDQHSGVVGGGARNPIGELMKLVSEMYDATTGRVKIKGFYNDVVPPTREELKDFVNSGFTVKGFKKDHGFKSIRTENAVDLMKRIWAMPTFEIHGLVGGYTGPGVKTVIPPRAEVKISCRLVPDQKPETIQQLVTDFVKSKNPDVEVIANDPMLPYRAPTTGPLATAVKSSMKYAFGREPVFVREGGSIGAVPTMEQMLRCPVMFIGLSLPEHGYHAPNENYDWPQASGGMVAFAKYFETLSKLPRT